MNQQEWDKTIKEHGGSILQSWIWGDFLQGQGYKVMRFSGQDWAAQVVEHELIMGKQYWYCPRGPIGNVSAAVDFLENEVEANRGITFLRLEPSEPVNLPEAPKTVQPKENWMVGLEGSEEELLLAMKPKHRYNINLAAKKGVKVREASKEDFLDVWQLFMETAGRGNFKLHNQNYYLQMWEKLGATNNLKVFVAEYEGEMLAASFVSIFNHTAVYLHGGSSDKNKQLMAPYLLHWEAMKAVKHLGLFNYDFGGISNDPNHAWAGITRFKKGFGGFEVKYPGTFDLVMSPLWYNVYRNARKLRKILK